MQEININLNNATSDLAFDLTEAKQQQQQQQQQNQQLITHIGSYI